MPATKQLGPNSLGALARFGLLALVPVVALGAILGHELNVSIQQRYLETARSSGSLITQVGIRPILNAQELTEGLTAEQIANVDDKLQGAADHFQAALIDGQLRFVEPFLQSVDLSRRFEDLRFRIGCVAAPPKEDGPCDFLITTVLSFWHRRSLHCGCGSGR